MKRNKELEQQIIEADQDWEDELEAIQAEGFGLTVEEFRQFQKLETEEEMQAFMNEHSKEA